METKWYSLEAIVSSGKYPFFIVWLIRITIRFVIRIRTLVPVKSPDFC